MRSLGYKRITLQAIHLGFHDMCGPAIIRSTLPSSRKERFSAFPWIYSNLVSVSECVDCALDAASSRAESIILALGSTPTTRLNGVSSVVACPLKNKYHYGALAEKRQIHKIYTCSAPQVDGSVPSGSQLTFMAFEYEVKKLLWVRRPGRCVDNCVKRCFTESCHCGGNEPRQSRILVVFTILLY
jgi:hypothetical protein